MPKYNLQPNEAVVLKAERIQRGTSLLSAFTDELVLTNVHLIWVNKGLVGNVKKIEYFPLALIRTFNDRAQAMVGKSTNGSPQLELYFQNHDEVFRFQTGGKREVGKWIEAINHVVTGNDAPSVHASARALPGTTAVAETLRDTLSQFRGAFGGSPVNSKGTPNRVKVSSSCAGCGASVSGWQESVAKCEYCDSEITLP